MEMHDRLKRIENKLDKLGWLCHESVN
jgi:hypothetical protein